MANSVANRAVITNPTNAQKEQKMMCEIINVANKSTEFARYYALNIWAVSYPTFNLGNQMLGALFDRLIRNARAYTPTVVYSTIDFGIHRRELFISGFRSNRIVNTSTSNANFTACVFNSPTFRIDAQRVFLDNTHNNLRWTNITFFLGANIAPIYYNISYTTGLNARNG